ncbi:MAG: lipopolysaccharide heptosyltransferase II [Chthoniobacterales bacterium]|nr:lipopolysaccharide heptosyltransferase II [Chthoniobacterales bacterium]
MDYAAYLLVLGLLAVLGRLPLELVFRAGALLGLGAWALLPGYRRLARRNMHIAFGHTMTEREIGAAVRRHFMTLGANLLSVPRLARMPVHDVDRRVELIGLPGLRAALDRGKGVVMAINHIGNWELYAQLISHVSDVPVGAVFQSQRNKYLNRLIDRDRRRLGLQTFDRRKGYLGAADLVESGGILAILVDQHAGDAALWTPLFGRMASTSTLAAIIAQKTGAPLVSVAIHTTGTARWRCVIEPPVEPAGKTVEELTAGLNRTLERQISGSPPDWFWVHNRWKIPGPFLLGRARRGFYLPPDESMKDIQPFRLLVRSSNWLGDAVMNIPAVEACKKSRPDLHLTILTPAKLAPLWRRVAGVDDVIEIRGKESPLALRKRVRREFDAAILFPNSLRSALEAKALGARRIVGYPGHWRRWLLGGVPKFTADSQGHHAERYLRLVEHFGAPKRDEPATFAPRPARARPTVPRIGICPGAEYGPAKRWPAEKFAAAMRLFHGSVPAEFVIFGVAGDAEPAQTIAGNVPFPVRNLVGRTSLDQLMDELAACDALLTNDTGTMHLAAFLGVPTVAVFGSTEPELTSPLGDFHRILRHKVECSPCFLRVCPIDFRCMTRLAPGEAAKSLHEVIGL